jgi:pilus assembly protein CpaC
MISWLGKQNRIFRVLAFSSLSTAIAVSCSSYCHGQNPTGGVAIPPTGVTLVSKSNETLQLMINSAHTLRTEEDIERASVHNDAIVTVRPMASNELMVSAKATGVTQVDLYGPDRSVRSVQVVVIGDARELDAILKSEFPMANLQLRPIQNALIISGQVNSDQHVEQAIAIAEQFYPTVINRIEVIGVQTVMLHVQIMEVSRTKLRQLGVDLDFTFGNDVVGTRVAGTTILEDGVVRIDATGSQFGVGILDNGNRFLAGVKALQERNLIKIMADPTLVAIDGRPASFNSGGEFPIVVPSGLGNPGIEFREYGTRLDFVAKVRGDGRIWLEVRPTISELDPANGVTLSSTRVPGLRSRFVDTAAEVRAGQTLAIAGLLQVRTEAQSSGIPGLCDIPYLGALFRSNREVQNEIELLIMVTPDFAGAMDPHEVPSGGPGFNSYSPSDKELYWRGYIETPTPCPPGGVGPSMNVCQPGMVEGASYSGTPNEKGVSNAAANSPQFAPLIANPATYRVSSGTNGVATQSPALPTR